MRARKTSRATAGFSARVDGLLRPAFGQVGVAVGAGTWAAGYPVVAHQLQGVARGPGTAGEPEPVGASGADMDGCGAVHDGEGRFGGEPVGIVSGGDELLGADDGTDCRDRQQCRVGGGDGALHPCPGSERSLRSGRTVADSSVRSAKGVSAWSASVMATGQLFASVASRFAPRPRMHHRWRLGRGPRAVGQFDPPGGDTGNRASRSARLPPGGRPRVMARP